MNDLSRDRLLAHLRILASDEMQGRQSGTRGSAKARAHIIDTLTTLGVAPLFSGYEQPFVFDGIDGDITQGFNIVGLVRGSQEPETYLVVSAHYDHLGQPAREGETYNGADDNASGVACLLEIARTCVDRRPRCSVVLCFFDGEEAGLEGSAAFVERAPIPLDRIVVVINVDMIGRADEGVLWAAGAHPNPWLAPHLDTIARQIDVPLSQGHDRRSLKRGENWTHESDHGSFHDAGVPWIYLGVSNHADTHEPTDEVKAIDENFFASAARAVEITVRHFDGAADLRKAS